MKKLLLIATVVSLLSIGSGIGVLATQQVVEAINQTELDSSYRLGIEQGQIDATSAALIHISEIAVTLPEIRNYYTTSRVNQLTDSLKHSRDSILLILKKKLNN